MEYSRPSRIAVIGSGVAGLTAAYVLSRRHRVVLFEKNNYIGGHTHTVTVPVGPDAGTAVDTGFIVMNHRNYPLFTKLLAQLGVPLRKSDMSFGYHNRASGIQYCGSSLNTMFAQRRNLFRPRFLGLLSGIARFYRAARADLASGAAAGLSLGEYLRLRAIPDVAVQDHIVPMGAAIWSTPAGRMMDFPAESFLRFFENHGLLSLDDRPQWMTVVGGSSRYVERLLERLSGEVRKDARVRGILRRDDAVRVSTADGAEEFDFAVVAAHADEALRLLEDPSDEESRLLGAWEYTSNRTVLHSDASVLPPLRRAWASWNYARLADDADDAMLTYDMTRLQGLQTRGRLLVTLNRPDPYPDGSVLAEMVYHHPTYTRRALDSQAALPGLNGRRRTFFCGSYFGYGFHEDAVRAGVDVARGMGLDL